MLPRMHAVTAAPSPGGAGSSWGATAGTPPWRGEVSAIPMPGCRLPPWAPWPGSASSRRTTWPGRCTAVPSRCAGAPSTPHRGCGAGAHARCCPPRSPARSAIPTPSSWSARPGSWASVATGRRCRPSSPPRPGTATPAAARPPWQRSAPSGTRRGSLPCWARSLTSRRCDGGPRWPWRASTTREVEPALRAAAEDRDWQVRQAAEELLDVAATPRVPDGSPGS